MDILSYLLLRKVIVMQVMNIYQIALAYLKEVLQDY